MDSVEQKSKRMMVSAQYVEGEAATRKAVVEKKQHPEQSVNNWPDLYNSAKPSKKKPRKKVVKKQKEQKLTEYEEDYLKRLEKPRKRAAVKKQKEKQRSYFERPVEWKSVPLAIILSFIWSGLGHLYISQIKKGIIFLAIGFVLGSLSWFDLTSSDPISSILDLGYIRFIHAGQTIQQIR